MKTTTCFDNPDDKRDKRVLGALPHGVAQGEERAGEGAADGDGGEAYDKGI